MQKYSNLICPCVLIVLVCAISPAAAGNYVEDFSTTVHKDSLNTTADWNTTTGELKLFPFVPTLTGSYDTPSAASDISLQGDIAFVADGGAGMQVIDISDLSNPVFIANFDTPNESFGIAVAGDYAFVADQWGGLQIIDISIPGSPGFAGAYAPSGFVAYGVVVAGDVAFVAGYQDGLVAIDISDPLNPSLIGSYDTPGYAYDLAVTGDLAFLADYATGLLVIDIADPANPVLTGSCDTPVAAYDIAVAGDLAFIADFGGGLQIIDISDPSSPGIIGNYDTPGSSYDVAVTGDLAFVADQSSGLQVIDITDPTNPVLSGSYDTPGTAIGVALAGDHAFVADGSGGGVQVVRVRAVVDPFFVDKYITSGVVYEIAVAGDHAFVADGIGGLKAFDITDPTSPVLAGSYDTPGTASGIAVAGDIAFVADYDYGLQVIDIIDPTSPVLLGNYDTPKNAVRVKVAGDHAFVADYGSGGGLQVIDISNPSSPAFAGSYDTPGLAFDLAVTGDLAFVTDHTTGLLVIDITDPTSPALAGSYDTPGTAIGIAVAGDHAFVADGTGGLQVIDITNPSNPIFAGSYDTPASAYSVAVVGDLSLVGLYENGLQALDITDPTNPVFIGSDDTPEYPRSIAVAGDIAFVAGENRGLHMIQVYQHEVMADSAVGQSLSIDGASDAIPRVRLTSTETPGVSWELSVDAGTIWTAIEPDGSWNRITVPGDDLLWRSTHAWSPGVNPTVSDLTIDWLNEFGPIASITDVPDDQGGWVRLNFTRSGYDFADESELPVTGYQIFRRVDDAQLGNRIRSEGNLPVSIARNKSALSSFDRSRIRVLDGREYVLGRDKLVGTGLPPGTWEVISWVAARQANDYLIAVPTFGDSTVEDGIHWTVLLITTHTTTPSMWFASHPDSGYSVDNIAPHAPTGFCVDYDYHIGNNLTWDICPDADFLHFRVYRGESEDFEIGPGTLVHETANTSWFDHEGQEDHHYRLTAMDRSGNESTPASPCVVTGIDAPDEPRVFALHQNIPNPFNPSTTIRFELPEAGNVVLDIFDVAGRHVATLLHRHLEAGRHTAIWHGRNDAGDPVSSGLYFYRLSGAGFSKTRKMLLLQ